MVMIFGRCRWFGGELGCWLLLAWQFSGSDLEVQELLQRSRGFGSPDLVSSFLLDNGVDDFDLVLPSHLEHRVGIGSSFPARPGLSFCG